MSVGSNIKKLRTSAMLTQMDLALKLGFENRFYIANWERDKNKPSKLQAAMLADFFNVDASYFKDEDIEIEIEKITPEERLINYFEQYLKDPTTTEKSRAKLFQTLTRMYTETNYK